MPIVDAVRRWMSDLRFTGGRKNELDTERSSERASAQHPIRPRTDREYVDYVNQRYDWWYQWRYPYEANWYLDVAFYLGLQWHEWNEIYRTLREPRAPSWRVRYIANLIMPAVETLVGQFQRGQPQLSCVPKQSPSNRSYVDARIGDKVLKGLWEPLHMADAFQEVLYWTAITGHAYLKTSWDPTMGDAVTVPGFPPFFPGEIALYPMGPFSILVPPYLKSPLRDASEMMEVRMYDVEHIRQLYPEIADKIKPDTDSERPTAFEERLVSLISPIGYTGYGKSDIGQRRKVLVKELWQEPQVLMADEREEFPDGRVTVIVSGELAHVANNPYKALPYVGLRGKVIPGRWTGGSLVDQLIGIQRNYNRTRSDVIESRMLCSRPMINVEKDHGITKPIAEPGKWLERKKGWAEPRFLDPPRMSDYHVKDIADTREDMQSVTQQRETTRGTLPAAATSGIAINFLQESDKLPLNPLAVRLASVYSEVGTRIIAIARQFYTEPRLITIAGEGHDFEVVEFLGDQHPTELRVRCSVESVMPESRTARQARVQEAVAAGILDPIKHRTMILRILQFGDVDLVWEMQDAHTQKARRENRMLAAGQLRMVDSFDDDEAHMLEHDMLRTSPQYEEMPPQTRAIIDAHCDMHLERLARLMGMGTGVAPIAPGAPPAGAGGVPPAAAPGGL